MPTMIGIPIQVGQRWFQVRNQVWVTVRSVQATQFTVVEDNTGVELTIRSEERLGRSTTMPFLSPYPTDIFITSDPSVYALFPVFLEMVDRLRESV